MKEYQKRQAENMRRAFFSPPKTGPPNNGHGQMTNGQQRGGGRVGRGMPQKPGMPMTTPVGTVVTTPAPANTPTVEKSTFLSLSKKTEDTESPKRLLFNDVFNMTPVAYSPVDIGPVVSSDDDASPRTDPVIKSCDNAEQVVSDASSP
jgi:hypothetical protein